METKTNFLDTYNLRTDFDISLTDNLNLLSRLGLSVEEIICLAGGCPCAGINDLNILIDTKSNNTVDVHVYCSEFESKQTIDFADMTIDNELMKVKHRGTGLGMYMLLNQVEAAKAHGFKQLDIYAMGGSNWSFNPEWNGYYTWGRTGFLMVEKSYAIFKGWLYGSGFSVTYLHEVLDFEQGRNAWRKAGFSWYGYFDLVGTASFDILRKYLVQRGITKHL